MADLTGRTVVVTGSSGDIGAEIVAEVGRAGANVVAHYGRHREAAEAATADIPDARRLLVSTDLTSPSAADELWAAAEARWGSVDVLVNNAGVMPEASVAADDEAWEAAWSMAWAVNVRTHVDLMRRAVRSFQTQGGGSIVTISSWVAQRGSANPGAVAYSASKAALAAATKTIARAHAKDGILAYCIAPGAVDSDMTWQAAESLGGREAVLDSLALGEAVPPAEIGRLVAFLASGACRHLSGSTIDVNGATYVR